MHIDRVRWWRYRIPFRIPFATAHGVLTQREGVLIELTSGTGVHGLGEIAPLPGFGGSVDELWRQLSAVVRVLLERGSDDLNVDDGCDDRSTWRRWPAALRCGVETALLDIAAQTAGCSLSALLRPQVRVRVPVNATVGTADTATAAERAAAAVAAGFATVKLKVGMETSVRAEVARVAAVREVIGTDTRLRLDANEAWTVETAISMIQRCKAFRLEWLEQPVAAADAAGLALVRRAAGTPIAADESVTGAVSVRALLAARAADVLILKPMMLGGPTATLHLAALASAAGVESVVTSTLETGVGLAAAAHAAAALPEPWRACGLATAALLEDDLLEAALRIERGEVLLPEGTGLGIHIDWGRLQHYTIATGQMVSR